MWPVSVGRGSVQYASGAVVAASFPPVVGGRTFQESRVHLLSFHMAGAHLSLPSRASLMRWRMVRWTSLVSAARARASVQAIARATASLLREMREAIGVECVCVCVCVLVWRRDARE